MAHDLIGARALQLADAEFARTPPATNDGGAELTLGVPSNGPSSALRLSVRRSPLRDVLEQTSSANSSESDGDADLFAMTTRSSKTTRRGDETGVHFAHDVPPHGPVAIAPDDKTWELAKWNREVSSLSAERARLAKQLELAQQVRRHRGRWWL